MYIAKVNFKSCNFKFPISDKVRFMDDILIYKYV